MGGGGGMACGGLSGVAWGWMVAGFVGAVNGLNGAVWGFLVMTINNGPGFS